MLLEFLLIFVSIIGIYYFQREREKYLKSQFPSGPYGIPIFGYLPFLGSVPSKTIAKLSLKWGPIFSLKLGSLTVVFINDFNTIKKLYKLDATSGRVHLDLFANRGKYGLALLEGDKWKELRRFLLRCLKDSGFGKKTMEGSIQEEVNQAITFMKNNTNKPLYLKPLIELAVINALWYLLTNEKYDIEDQTKKNVAEIMAQGLSDQNIVGVAAFLPRFAKLFPNITGYNKALKYFGAPEDLAREIIDKHMRTYIAGKERDFIDHTITKILSTTDIESVFYKETGMRNLHYTLIDLFFAGSDTLSSTLGWSFLYLSMWPEKQNQIHFEIDQVIGRSRVPCLDDRIKMPYMEATMTEVFRLSSMVPLGLLHRALDDIQFENYVFPKDTIFLANMYNVFNDPSVWNNPEEFCPERFLGTDGKYQKNERMIPFFTGKRSCPGENLAMVEYFLFLTGILQNFQFSLSPNEPRPDIGARSGFILPPPKHKLVITER